MKTIAYGALILFTTFISLSSVVCSAEFETFTLQDGRTISGYYDEATQTLTMAGAGSASIKVKVRDIVKREPATPPETKAKPEPGLLAEKPPAQTKGPTLSDIDAAMKAYLAAQYEYQTAKGRGIRIADDKEAKADKAAIAAAVEKWESAQRSYHAVIAHACDSVIPGSAEALAKVEAIDLKIKQLRAEADKSLIESMVKISELKDASTKLSDDPTKSEMERAQRAGEFNGMIRTAKDMLRSHDPINAADFARRLTDPHYVALLVEFGRR